MIRLLIVTLPDYEFLLEHTLAIDREELSFFGNNGVQVLACTSTNFMGPKDDNREKENP